MARTGFVGERFTEVIYLEAGGTGSGKSESSPLDFVAGDLMSIPAGCVITKAFVIIDTAIAGTTNLDVGDDDDADGFVDGSLSVTLGTPGMYGWNAKVAGAYLRVETAGATDPGDVYVVPNAKYYSAAGKEVKLAVSGTNSAGKARVVVEGYYVGVR
jgi:hypothetical protein